VSTQGAAPAPARPLVASLGAMAAVGLLGLAATVHVALRSSRGLRLDRAASDAVSNPALVLARLYEGRGWATFTVGLLLLLTVLLAMARARADLALGALVVIGGANLTSRILKYGVLPGLDLRPEPASLPSGHATAALSVAITAVILARPAWRWTVAVAVSAAAAFVGVAMVLGRHHQPLDIIAAIFVCLLWAAAGLLTALLVRHRSPAAAPAPGAPVSRRVVVSISIGGALLVWWGVRPQPDLQDLWLGVAALGFIGLACAASVAAVARLADRHLG